MPLSSFFISTWVIYAFFIISIRFVFLLEIKNAVIFGISASSITIFVHFLYLGFSFFGMSSEIVMYFTFEAFIYEKFIVIILILILNIRMYYLSSLKSVEEESITKKIIIEYGRKMARLKLRDISDKANANTSTIIRILKYMIENEEIYAEYFKSSKTIAFNQIKNVEEIDNLMKLYEKWEQNQFKKQQNDLS